MADIEEKKVEKKAKGTGKPNVFRRFANWLRSLNSERKKISWATWKSVRKNTLIVILVVVVLAVAIGVVDFLLSQGIIGLGRIIAK